jgi:hypothetical protein
MTKRLEELFDMNDDDENQTLNEPIFQPSSVDNDFDATVEEPPKPSQNTLDTIAKVEHALPQVRGLESSDAEMDDLAALAKEAFNNLMDLGMQVEARHASEIFNSASSMLGHAITAKTAKVNKKLKMIDLQLKKAALDQKLNIQSAKVGSESTEKLSLGTGQVIDRDELIKQILKTAEEQKQNKSDK